MLFKTKKIIFFFLAILSIPLLLYWILYDLGECFSSVVKFQTSIGLYGFFRDDAVLGPIIYTLILFPLASIIYLIFYRKECSMGVKLVPLLISIINASTSIHISSAISQAFWNDQPSIGWKALLVLYVLITLAALVWLIVAMIKYPKQEPKTA